jgi:hypothetical protein
MARGLSYGRAISVEGGRPSGARRSGANRRSPRPKAGPVASGQPARTGIKGTPKPSPKPTGARADRRVASTKRFQSPANQRKPLGGPGPTGR